MKKGRRTCVKRKLNAEDCHSNHTQRAIMDDHSSTQSFAAHHHHHSFHLNLRNLQTAELGYTSTQSSLDPLEQYGNREEESTTSFLISTPSSVERRARNGSDRGLLNASGSSLDRDPNIGSHLDGEQEIGSHFADTWYGSSKKDVWEDGESFESSAEYFYSKGECYSKLDDVLHTMNCGNDEGIRYKLPANNNSHANCETKSEAVIGYQANSYSRSGSESLDYCRTNSTASDNYTGRDEDYGSSCGSGEDHLQPSEIEGPWLSASPSRRPTDTHTLASGCLLQHSPIGSSRTYPQKLDSFSEAFLSQGKRTFTGVPSGDFAGQSWEFGRGESPGLGKSRHSCAFDSDSCLPPASSSPVHSSRGSFPSPPTSSHLVSSVLSPPPTPRPPPSYSPSKMDSPSAFGATGHSVSHGGESLGTLQFFASHLQSLPSVNSSGMIWRFPVMAQNFSQSSSNISNVKINRRPSQGNVTASQNIPKSAEPPFLASSHLPSALCHSTTPSLHSPFHLPSLSSQHYETTENIAPFTVTHRRQNGSTNQNPSQLQHQSTQTYTGTPFPSMLRSCRGQKRGHYTPRPLLDPARRGQGLYSSLLSHCHRAEVTAGGPEDDSDVLPYINVGSDFQAEVPPCFLSNVGSEVWSPEEESPQERLLWKPCDKLQHSTNIQEQVEKLLSMCSSSCLPGGGSNTELALHCLHYCQGDTMATLEMLLFSKPSPTGNYHYSGSDFWTDTEKTVFSAALGTYGKEFPLIQKMVRTKTIRQCVEFFYLNKKLQDKQEKQKEEESRNSETERQTSITPSQPVNRPFALEEVVPVPSLAGFFPCKLCGKMFYKIKSRNAHMKIHRQPQEDWTDRRLQHQLLTQHLGSNLLPAQVPVQSFSSSLLQGRKSSAETVLNSLTNSLTIAPSNTSILDPSAMATCSNNTASSSHVITDNDGGESAAILPFYQSWSSFGHSPDPASFFCNTEGKDVGAAGTVGSKEPIKWQ